MLDTLFSLGFEINHEKFCLEPGHVKDYLQYVIDTSKESVIHKALFIIGARAEATKNSCD